MSTPRERIAELRVWVASDSYAATFQTLGQYRSAMLKAVDDILAALAPAEPAVRDDEARQGGGRGSRGGCQSSQPDIANLGEVEAVPLTAPAEDEDGHTLDEYIEVLAMSARESPKWAPGAVDKLERAALRLLAALERPERWTTEDLVREYSRDSEFRAAWEKEVAALARERPQEPAGVDARATFFQWLSLHHAFSAGAGWGIRQVSDGLIDGPKVSRAATDYADSCAAALERPAPPGPTCLHASRTSYRSGIVECNDCGERLDGAAPEGSEPEWSTCGKCGQPTHAELGCLKPGAVMHKGTVVRTSIAPPLTLYGDDEPGPAANGYASKVFDLLERWSPAERARAFYEMENRWCWTCGAEGDCGCPCVVCGISPCVCASPDDPEDEGDMDAATANDIANAWLALDEPGAASPGDGARGDTEYLLSSPANAERLMAALAQSRAHEERTAGIVHAAIVEANAARNEGAEVSDWDVAHAIARALSGRTLSPQREEEP